MCVCERERCLELREVLTPQHLVDPTVFLTVFLAQSNCERDVRACVVWRGKCMCTSVLRTALKRGEGPLRGSPSDGSATASLPAPNRCIQLVS